MKVLLGILAAAGIVAVVAVGGHWLLTEAAKGSGSVASAAQSTCSLCHETSSP